MKELAVLLFACSCAALGWVGTQIHWMLRGHRGQCPFYWMSRDRLHSCELRWNHAGDHRCVCGRRQGGSRV